MGNGDGPFTPKNQNPRPATGIGPVSIAVGEFDGDVYPDLAVVNQTSGSVSILDGNGEGTFASLSTAATGRSPSSRAAGYFNSASYLALAATNSNHPIPPCPT